MKLNLVLVARAQILEILEKTTGKLNIRFAVLLKYIESTPEYLAYIDAEKKVIEKYKTEIDEAKAKGEQISQALILKINEELDGVAREIELDISQFKKIEASLVQDEKIAVHKILDFLDLDK